MFFHLLQIYTLLAATLCLLVFLVFRWCNICSALQCLLKLKSKTEKYFNWIKNVFRMSSTWNTWNYKSKVWLIVSKYNLNLIRVVLWEIMGHEKLHFNVDGLNGKLMLFDNLFYSRLWPLKYKIFFCNFKSLI